MGYIHVRDRPRVATIVRVNSFVSLLVWLLLPMVAIVLSLPTVKLLTRVFTPFCKTKTSSRVMIYAVQPCNSKCDDMIIVELTVYLYTKKTLRVNPPRFVSAERYL